MIASAQQLPEDVPVCYYSSSYAQSYAACFGLEYDPEDLQAVFDLYENSVVPASIDTAILEIVLEEAQAYFDGDKTAMEVGDILNNRISIYLSEQS